MPDAPPPAPTPLLPDDDLDVAAPTPAYPRWQLWGAVALGLTYGLTMRLLAGDILSTSDGAFEVMTVGFIYFVPVIIGFLTVYVSPGETPSWGRSVLLPLVPMTLTLAAAFALFWEGLICIVVWLPLAAVLAMGGGLVAAIARRLIGRPRPMVLAGAAVFPFAVMLAEDRMPAVPQTHVVEDVVVIAASPEAVWDEIRSVPAIAPAELGGSFAHAIGFPRPIAAELEGTGVGSVRHASFEGGVVFREVVTEWAENRALAFTIDPGAVPPETFDQHVAVGGPYFDVLDGRYVIEPISPAADGAPRVRLRLASTHRLSTTFNGYTRLWTDLFMRDIQQAILDVIRDRAEGAAVAQAAR